MSKKSKLLPTPRATEGGAYKDNQGNPKASGIRAVIENKLLPTMTTRDNRMGCNQKTLYKEIASCSPPDSPASPSQMQDESEARQMTVTSGLKLSGLLKPSSPIGLFLKMCLESSTWYSPIVELKWQAKPLFTKYRMTKSQTMTQSQDESSQTSDRQGMKQYGLLYQLVPSTPPIDGTESGLLATPQAMDFMEPKTEKAIQREATETRPGRTKFANLKEQIAHGIMLPTPDCSDRRSQKSKQQGLSNIIQMLPTPAQTDYKGESQFAKYNNPHRTSDAIVYQDGKKTGMKLQPEFVEWMQGFPIGWTDLNHSETL
jgi:hypothetical protein